jgi:hypothetical protein
MQLTYKLTNRSKTITINVVSYLEPTLINSNGQEIPSQSSWTAKVILNGSFYGCIRLITSQEEEVLVNSNNSMFQPVYETENASVVEWYMPASDIYGLSVYGFKYD